MRKIKIPVLGLAALSLCPLVSQAGDGVVALQTADPSCPDDSGNIYVDCGNGTVTDNRTGLVWLKNADCLSNGVNWFTAMEVVKGLSDLQGSDPDDCGLSDGSSPGEWRLPSKGEWEAMIADAVALGCDPTITDDQGTGCWSSCNGSGACAFTKVVPDPYWSSTSLVAFPSAAWTNALGLIALIAGKKSAAGFYAWPVRGGQ